MIPVNLPQPLKSPLTRRMLAWTLSVVLLTTMAESAFHLYFTYYEDVGGVRKSVQKTVRPHLSSLSYSLYRMDEIHLRLEMEALLQDPDIAYLAVWGAGDFRHFKAEIGQIQLPHEIRQSYRLVHRLPAGKGLQVGYLQISIDLSGARDRLWRNTAVDLITDGLAILAVSLAILFLLHMGVTRHLSVMARHAAAIDLSRLDKPLALKRFFHRQHPDEIDQVVQAMNNLQLRLREDIEQRLRMEHRLQQAQKMESLGTLAGGVAHDINNMLGIILGQTELALSSLPADSPVRERLELSLQGVDRAKDIVHQILAFSRRTELRRRPIEISRTVKDAMSLLRTTVPKTIELTVDLAPETGYVIADPTEIQQVLMNLCSNSAHAMTKGGRLIVSLQRVMVDENETNSKIGAQPGNYALITVRDTGEGMDPKTLERIFEPYFTTKELGKGTGLGLSVVHGIIHGLHGFISAYSAPGMGSSFRIFLPIAPEEGEEAPSAEILPGGNERILLVDDEDLVARTSEASLEKLGYKVTRFVDSHAALEAYRASPEDFDGLITDLTMPGLGGLDLVKSVREIRADLPVVLCSGFSESMDKIEARKTELGEFVMKPILRMELAKALRRALDRHALKTSTANKH